MGWREYHNSPSKNFCLTILSIFVGENSVFEKISGIQKFYGKKVDGGSIINSRQKIFVSQYRKTSLGKTSMFQKVSGIENLRDKRKGGYHTFPLKIRCLTMPQKSRRGTLVLQKNFSIEKHYG